MWDEDVKIDTIHMMQEDWGYNVETRRETDVYLQSKREKRETAVKTPRHWVNSTACAVQRSERGADARHQHKQRDATG